MKIIEKIVWFMLGKAEKVKELCDVKYFTDKDIESLQIFYNNNLEFV